MGEENRQSVANVRCKLRGRVFQCGCGGIFPSAEPNDHLISTVARESDRR